MGSLTGVVASQSVPEAREGLLRLVGNQPVSAMAKASLSHTDKSYSRDNRLMLPKRP